MDQQTTRELTSLSEHVLADAHSFRSSRGARVAQAVTVAALSGIPWVGSIVAAAKALHDEEEAGKHDETVAFWVHSHEQKIDKLRDDLDWVLYRLDELGDDAMARAESPEYLGLVRQAFRGWDQAETEEKRTYFRRILVNHAGAPLTSDDVARFFIEWIARYHEKHFQMIAFVANHRGTTKREMGVDLFGLILPVDASPEAGLFRELFRELNLGGIIRQAREVDGGRFLRRPPKPRTAKGIASPYVDATFDDDDDLEVSELGRWFVHYVLTDSVLRLHGE